MTSVLPALWRVCTPREVWAVGVVVWRGEPGAHLGRTVTKFPLLMKKRRFLGVLSVLGEFFPAYGNRLRCRWVVGPACLRKSCT